MYEKNVVIILSTAGAAYLVFLAVQSWINTGRDPITAAELALRGITNNNPMNLKYEASNNWVGQTGSDGTFCVFDTAEHGIRAGMILILGKVANGINTLAALGDIWAPPASAGGDNNSVVGQYGAGLASYLSVDPNTEYDLGGNIVEVAKAIVHNEEGIQPYSDATYQQAALDAASEQA